EAESRLEAATQAGDTAALMQIADVYPNSKAAPEAMMQRARLLAKREQFGPGASSFRQLLRLEAPSNADATKAIYIELIDCLNKAGNGNAAHAWAARAARRFPGLPLDSPQLEPPLMTLCPPASLAGCIASISERWKIEFGEIPMVLTPRFENLSATTWDT